MDEQTEVDADAMEDFYVALSAAIESGIDSSAHAACDLYHAALARAEAAEAEVAPLKARCEKRHDEWRTAEGERDAERARAEVAEAEVARLRDENAEAWFAFERQQSRGDRLAVRVAELEAAQEWQSRSETPNAIDTYLVYRAAPPQNEPWRYDFAVWEDDGWDTEGFTHYRPRPPAPQETE